MGNAASKVGWLIFMVALAGAALRTGPDDPMTAGMKSSGMYQPFLVVMGIVVGLLFIRLAFATSGKTVAMRRQLDELKRKGR